MRKFVILLIISLIYTFMYNELGIIRKALLCIIRYCPYLEKKKKKKKRFLTRFAMKLFIW